jgi:hypothetical protein
MRVCFLNLSTAYHNHKANAVKSYALVILAVLTAIVTAQLILICINKIS